MNGTQLLARMASSRAAAPVRGLVGRLVPAGPRTVTIRGGLARGVRASLDLRSEKAFWLGHYEPAVQSFLERHVRPGDAVYDVGANVGFFSLCAAALGARVYAFEPDRANADRLRRNAAVSGLPIVVVEAAVWEDDAGATLVPGDSALEWRTTGGGPVSTVTLDGFAAANEPPAVVKIDVEGAELPVLLGARSILAGELRALTCEVHTGVDPSAVEALFEGFEIRWLGKTRIEAVRTYHGRS